MSYILEHTVLSFCGWDIPALIIFVGLIVLYAVQSRNMKKEKKELEDRLSGIYADDTVKFKN